MHTVTPEMVANIMLRANRTYAAGHALNQNNALVAQCKLGTVFVDSHGDYCVYTGIDGRNRRFPVMFTRVHDRATRKGVYELLNKIAKASQN